MYGLVVRTHYHVPGLVTCGGSVGTHAHIIGKNLRNLPVVVEFNIVTFNFLSPNQGVSMYGLVAGYNPHHPTMVPGMINLGQGLFTHMIRLRNFQELVLGREENEGMCLLKYTNFNR